MPAPLGQLVADPRVRSLLATLGTPYHWGRGSPATQWPSVISNALENGWRLITNSGRMSAASLREDDVAMAAYISGRLDERGV